MNKSSSYYESLTALNKRFASEKKKAMVIKEAPEQLEDEDLLEMLNAGLVAIIVVDKHMARFWKQVFPKIKVHDGIAVRTGSEIAWAIRKDSPELKRMLDQIRRCGHFRAARKAARAHPRALSEEHQVPEECGSQRGA